MLFPEAPDSCGKNAFELIFAAFYELKKFVPDF